MILSSLLCAAVLVPASPAGASGEAKGQGDTQNPCLDLTIVQGFDAPDETLNHPNTDPEQTFFIVLVIDEGKEWLRLEKKELTLPPNTNTQNTLFLDTAELPTGSYEGRVRVTDAGVNWTCSGVSTFQILLNVIQLNPSQVAQLAGDIVNNGAGAMDATGNNVVDVADLVAATIHG